MKQLILFSKMLKYSILFLSFIITVSFTNDRTFLISTSKDVQLRNENVTDGTQMAPQVKQKVADYYHIQTTDVSTCYYYQTTLEGYFQYRFAVSLGPTGSFFITEIIGEDCEGLLYED